MSHISYLDKNRFICANKHNVWKITAYHLLFLVLVCLFAFTRNPGMLLAGNDGATGYSLAEEQLSFYGLTLDLHSNLLEGLGNTSIPYNLTLQPGYWYSVFISNKAFGIALLYTWFAIQLFVSVLLIGWNHGFRSRASFMAAWLLTILAFPFFTVFRIYPITGSMPNFVSMILIFAIMDIGIQRMGKNDWLESFAYGGLSLAGFTLGLITSPVLIPLIVPIVLLMAAYSFANVVSRQEFVRKLTVALVLLCLVVAFGWFDYLIGMLLNASGMFFKTEMNESGANVSSLIYASILFHGKTAGMAAGTWLFSFSTLGCVLAIRQRTNMRLLAIFTLLGQIGIVGGGIAATKLFPVQLSTVSTIYFEILLFPFYALFTVYFWELAIRKLFKSANSENNLARTMPIIICLLMLSAIIIQPRHKNDPNRYSVRPHSSSMIDVLEAHIALNLNQPFNGRVVNILPNQNWLQQLGYFSTVNLATKNDHQSTGLWLKHIPTLHEYNQSITPEFYRMYRRFLSDGTDHPYRSWSNFNKVDTTILRLLGVKYIISSLDEISDTRRVDASMDLAGSTLNLFELSDVNTAGISAARIVEADNYHTGEDIMASATYRLKDAVMIGADEYLTEKLVPSTASKLTMDKHGLRLQATSKGQTLLILPVGYSHCLNTKPISGKQPKIMRVDLALMGVLFDKSVDIIVDNRTGPFTNPRCRFEDYKDFAKLWNTQGVA